MRERKRKVTHHNESPFLLLHGGLGYFYLRILIAELLEVWFHQCVDVNITCLYLHLSFVLPRVMLHLLLQCGAGRHYLLGMLKEKLSLAGKGYLSFLSGKQLCVIYVFQFLDVLGYGRLGDLKLF